MANHLLSGRVALVTGAADGIGRATGLLLAEHGATVHLSDIRDIQENRPLFERLGITFHICDVRHEMELKSLIDGVVEQSGKIDILVNNAGVGMVKQITEVSEQDWDFCIDTNLKGPFFGCKHAIQQMQQTGGGAIVNIASNAGLLPRAHDPVYSISKLALVGLTKSLALCHAKDRIRINAVCPGPVGDTGMIRDDIARAADPEQFTQSLIDASPLAKAHQRMITPREIAEAVLYLVSDQSCMVTGTSIAIDGGKSLGVPPRS